MKDQKQLWNIVSSSGHNLNETPIEGTEEQATAYMNCKFSHCELAPFEPIDLNKIDFQKLKNANIIVHSKEKPEFICKILDESVGIIDEDDGSVVHSLPIEQLRLFPNFKHIE